MADMNKIIANRIKRKLETIDCEAKMDAAGVYQVYWHGKQTEFVYVDINTLYDELNEIVTSIQARTNASNVDIFWLEIQANIKKIKSLPDSVIITVGEGMHESYGNIYKGDLHCDDAKAWVELSKRHTLTLFEKADYVPMNKNESGDMKAIAKGEVEHVFTFSKKITYSQLFEDSGQWN